MSWTQVANLSAAERKVFANKDSVFALKGDSINDSKTSYTQRIEVEGRFYYVKRYLRAGKNLRRFIGFSRVQREWWNQAWFARNGIPTPRRIAMGEGNRRSGEYWGVIVSEEVSQTLDLRQVYNSRPELLANQTWRHELIEKLAEVVSNMHKKRFIHNDLQWRNVLVSSNGRVDVHLIDCPAGRPIYLLGNRRGIVRDLALLDKMAKLALSHTDRLRFYKQYMGIDRLRKRDKREISRVLSFIKPSK